MIGFKEAGGSGGGVQGTARAGMRGGAQERVVREPVLHESAAGRSMPLECWNLEGGLKFCRSVRGARSLEARSASP